MSATEQSPFTEEAIAIGQREDNELTTIVNVDHPYQRDR